MGGLSNVPFLGGYLEQDQINRAREQQGMQQAGQFMTLQKMQQDMQNAPAQRALQNRLIESQIGENDLKTSQFKEKQVKDAETQKMVELWQSMPDTDPMKPVLQQKIRIRIDPGNALDPAKSSNLPWYVKRGPDGKTTIDPAFAEYEKAKAREGKAAAPFFQFLPTTEGYAAGNARTGMVAPVVGKDGKPLVRAQDSPMLQGQIAESKKLGADIGEQRATIPTKETAISSIGDATKMLDAGIYSGAWGPVQLQAARYTPGYDKKKVSNTQEFLSHIGNVVVPRLKEFGGNDSNEELRYLKAITGGDISIEPTALRNILVSAEKKMKKNIERLNSGQGVPKNRMAPPAAAQPSAVDAALEKYK